MTSADFVALGGLSLSVVDYVPQSTKNQAIPTCSVSLHRASVWLTRTSSKVAL